ncbi:MAG: chromate transporter [Clostridia bacterium]|jgi:chromate transporter
MFTILKLFLVFFKIGLFGFGGGIATLPMIFNDIQTFNIMSVKDFSDIVALSQITPGPIALSTATFVGFRTAGIGGSISAIIGFALPSLIIVIIVSSFFNKFKTNPIVESVLNVIRPTTIGMIFAAAFILFASSVLIKSTAGNTLFTNPQSLISIPALIIFVLALFFSAKTKINPIILMLAAGIIGAFVI